LGNFIADSITNKEYHLLPEEVKLGVKFHRQVDSYTDNHPLVRKGYKRLYPHFGKYAPVVSDIYYDYLLTLQWNSFSEASFDDFCNWIYSFLSDNMNQMPAQLQRNLPHMIGNRWLESYGTLSGIDYAFKRLGDRVKFKQDFSEATLVLKEHLDSFQEEFSLFFPQAISHLDGLTLTV